MSENLLVVLNAQNSKLALHDLSYNFIALGFAALFLPAFVLDKAFLQTFALADLFGKHISKKIIWRNLVRIHAGELMKPNERIRQGLDYACGLAGDLQYPKVATVSVLLIVKSFSMRYTC